MAGERHAHMRYRSWAAVIRHLLLVVAGYLCAHPAFGCCCIHCFSSVAASLKRARRLNLIRVEFFISIGWMTTRISYLCRSPLPLLLVNGMACSHEISIMSSRHLRVIQLYVQCCARNLVNPAFGWLPLCCSLTETCNTTPTRLLSQADVAFHATAMVGFNCIELSVSIRECTQLIRHLLGRRCRIPLKYLCTHARARLYGCPISDFTTGRQHVHMLLIPTQFLLRSNGYEATSPIQAASHGSSGP